MAVFWVYVTASNLDEARRLARILVEERLAACANVWEKVTSFYWWEGRLEEDQEAVLVLKTREEILQRLITRVKELHSYTCPCIVALPIQTGFEPFLEWVRKETQEAG